MKQVKQFIINLIAGANLFTVALLLLVGYSDRLSPQDHPLLACVGMTFPFFFVANVAFLVFWTLVSWRKLWIPLAGLVLAYVPIRLYTPLNITANETEGTLKLVSYNVCAYGGNFKYEDAAERIMAYLDAQQPDIVCLQEDTGNKQDVRSMLRQRYAYNETVLVNTDPVYENAVGIHTRFPILRKERIDYESEANGTVAWYLLIDGDTVIVINNHLEGTHISSEQRDTYTKILKGDVERDQAQQESVRLLGKLSTSMEKRASQVQIIHRYIEDHRQYPIVVCGDFNDTPISYTRRTMAQGLTDCYEATGRGPGLSYNRKGFNFRIDYALCSSHFEPRSCRIDSSVDYSDHYPLVCCLKKKDNP